TERCPVAAGYRVGRQDSWLRRFYSWGYNVVVRLLLGTGVRDCDCALKVFRREALANVLPETAGFFVNAEMLARARQQGHEGAGGGAAGGGGGPRAGSGGGGCRVCGGRGGGSGGQGSSGVGPRPAPRSRRWPSARRRPDPGRETSPRPAGMISRACREIGPDP